MEVLDQRTKILNNRHVACVQNYLSDEDKRRMKAYAILDHYYVGTSKNVLSLEQSLADNYIDSGIINYLSERIATLVLYGFGLVVRNAPNADLTDKWIHNSNLYNALLQAEIYASLYGDAYVKVTYDYDKQTVVFLPINPQCVSKYKDTIVLITQDIQEHDTLYIEQYYTDKDAVYMRTGTVNLNAMYTAFNNIVHPVQLLKTEYIELSTKYLPIIHIPNNICEDGYGTSDFANVLDLVDVYNQILTDSKIGLRHNALPAIFISGTGNFKVNPVTNKIQVQYSPNAWYDLGQNGSVTKIDNSNALDLLMKQEKAVYEKIVRTCGLSLAGLGEFDISNSRQYQIRLMYAPTVNTIERKRYDRLPYYNNIIQCAYELWLNIDKSACIAVLADGDITYRFDGIVPIDINEEVTMLTNVKVSGGISQKTYIQECLKKLGINSTVDDELTSMKAEQVLDNL